MKQKLRILKILTIICLLISFMWLINQISKEDICNENYEKLKYRKFKGLVIDKFIDKENHYTNDIKLNFDDSIYQWSLHLDYSGLYDYIEIGDSLIKNGGSYEVLIYRNKKKDTIFILDYNCK